MNKEQEQLYAMALARLNHFHTADIMRLYNQLGSATAIIEHRNHLCDVVDDVSPRFEESLRDISEVMSRAEEEMRFTQQYAIEVLLPADNRYPQRLRECEDAPLVLYYKGTAPLNVSHVICVVGTRRSTPYASDLIRRLISDLQIHRPDVLVVSGLAYGVDICAHRQALDHALNTVGVLAHGLDDLYPSRHRETARKMVAQGGLLTEFMSGTNADKINFVRRNRIVAGMSDACIVVESAAKGGGLITADIARSYGREIFAFPGRVGDPYSEGCNNLIRDNGAMLITGADDLMKAMGWNSEKKHEKAKQKGIERQLFPQLSPEEQRVADVLAGNNDLNINMLSVQSGLSVGQLSAILFEMEMKGLVKAMAGGVYHILL